MCEGASKQFQNLKIFTALGPRPPIYKFLDPPLHPYSHSFEGMNGIYHAILRGVFFFYIINSKVGY